MGEHAEELEIAESFLSDMLDADHAGDFEGFIKHFDEADIEGFEESDFLEDVERMREDLGVYKSRFYLGSLNGFKTENHPKCIRFVWRATYEKNEALIIVGIHEKNGTWYVNENVVSK